MRKSNRSLFLIELMASILILSLVSALSLQLFTKAKVISTTSKNLSTAALESTNIAERYLAYDDVSSYSQDGIDYILEIKDTTLHIQCMIDKTCIYELEVIRGEQP